MLTREEDVEIHALHQRGWSISAIARHTGRNRRTIRNYINGVTAPGVRKPAGEDSFAPFVDYVSARLREDPHGTRVGRCTRRRLPVTPRFGGFAVDVRRRSGGCRLPFRGV